MIVRASHSPIRIGITLLCCLIGLLCACSDSDDESLTVAVEGFVRDDDGAPIAGARVAIEYSLDSVANTPYVVRTDPPPEGVPIVFTLPERADWTIVISDYRGDFVRAFAGQDVGTVSLFWDGDDEEGQAVPDGMYYSSITAGGVSGTRKLLVWERCFGMGVSGAYLALTDARGAFAIDWDIVPLGESIELLDEWGNVWDTAWVSDKISVCARDQGFGSSEETVLKPGGTATVEITISSPLIPDPR